MNKNCLTVLMGFIVTSSLMGGIGLTREAWKVAACDITDALSSMSDQLLQDIDSFDRLFKELGCLDELVCEREEADLVFYQRLKNRYAEVVQAYNNCLAAQATVRIQGNYDIQQLKVTLVALQTMTQEQIEQLKTEYAEAQIQLQQLVDSYNQFVQGDPRDAEALINLLRSICQQYSAMVDRKQMVFDEISKLIDVLDSHIALSYDRITHAS